MEKTSTSTDLSRIPQDPHETVDRLKELVKIHTDIERKQEIATTENQRSQIIQNEVDDRVYQVRRLSMIVWFVWYLKNKKNRDLTIITAIYLMDRYIKQCDYIGLQMRSMLRDVRSIGMACLVMTNKMFTGELFIDDNMDVMRVPEMPRRDRARKRVDDYWARDEDMADEVNIAKWERDITTTMNGGLFMIEVDRVIDVMCAYIIRAVYANASVDYAEYLANARKLALSYLIKTILDASTYSRFQRWQRVAGACLLAVKHVIRDGVVENVTTELFTDLGYEDVCHVVECSVILAGECTMCDVSFPSKDMTSALRSIAGSYCTFCRERCAH